MRKRIAVIGVATAAVLLLGAQAQAEDRQNEPAADIEIGAAGEWALPGGGSSFGPSVAVEFTPIKNWPEVELGVSPLFSRNQTEWDTELVFYKSLISFGNVEVSFGAGPEWQHQIGAGEVTDSIGATTSLDFQAWQSPEQKIGWFVEPSYSYSFGSGHERSFGVTVGMLIAIP